MNTSPPPVLYRVTDSEGDLIMLAPLETLGIIFDLKPPAVSRLLLETRTLGVSCKLHFNDRPKFGFAWVEAERLPIGIPAGERTDEKV